MSYPNQLFCVSYADLQNTKRAFANAKAGRTLVFLYLIYIGRRLINISYRKLFLYRNIYCIYRRVQNNN